MTELLNRIYNEMIYYERDTVEMDKEVEEEIKKLTQPYQGRLTEKEYEELLFLLRAISLTAEQGGFFLGAKYALKTLFTLLMD